MALTNVDLDRIDGNSGSLANVSTSALNGGPLAGTRNRIINGDMRIAQRGTAQVNVRDSVFPVDRFRFSAAVNDKATGEQSSVAPQGFTNSVLITSTGATTPGASDDYSFQQIVEGFNIADLGWGTANARAVTLSFWVRSSLTGQFGGALVNAVATATRSYPFSYTISAANTWEYKTITIAGDTSGTWANNNGAGIGVRFNLGSGSSVIGTAGSWAGSNFYGATGDMRLVGTNGATFYITGVQLEAGTVATPFERRSYGQELALCQRYYQLVEGGGAGLASGTTGIFLNLMFPEMRTAPSIGLSAALTINDASSNFTQSSAAIASQTAGPRGAFLQLNNFTGLTLYRPFTVRNPDTQRFTLAAEL